jgi:hypothetical protein
MPQEDSDRRVWNDGGKTKEIEGKTTFIVLLPTTNFTWSHR